jgi:thiol-disulfide isomerase/thioredoxin
MARATLSLLLALLAPLTFAAQESSDPVSQALAQGDLYQSKRKYELALDAYHKADKLSHHSSAASYLKLSLVERKLGDFSAALDDAKHALKVAGDNKTAALQAHLVRATLLTQMAGKPTDKKLKEAEEELRQALALDSTSAVAHLDLGMVLLRQERDAEGIPELNTFISSPNVDSRSVAEARLVIANPIRARTPFAPHFSFTTHENQNVSNASLHGKVVLLDFWGTWCPPCRESVPILRDLNKKYTGKPFQLVGISSDNDEDVWKTFIQAQHMDWSEYIDLSDEVLQAFKVESFPTYIVLDKDGVIRFRQSGLGEYTQGELADAINKALKRESDPKLAAAAAAEAAPTTSANASPAGSLASDSGKPAADSSTPLFGIEDSSVSGNVYKNDALSLSYEFPRGWIAAKPQSLHVLNDRSEAAAKAAVLQQHPELADSLRFSTPKIVFYASRKGDGDGQRLGLPSLRISATPSRLDSLRLSAFQQMMEHMSVASGLKLFAPASEYAVNKHQFLRADFERTSGGTHVYQSYVQTLSEDYLLTVEIFASSPEELQQIAASLQAMSITEEDP